MGLILFLIKVTVPRIFKRVLDHYGHRLELAELIMNTRRAPALWLTRQLEGLAQNPSPDRAARLQGQAVRISIKNLKAIIKFLSNANTYDTPETRHMVLKELNAIRREWEEKGWSAVEPDPDYVPVAGPGRNGRGNLHHARFGRWERSGTRQGGLKP